MLLINLNSFLDYLPSLFKLSAISSKGIEYQCLKIPANVPYTPPAQMTVHHICRVYSKFLHLVSSFRKQTNSVGGFRKISQPYKQFSKNKPTM